MNFTPNKSITPNVISEKSSVYFVEQLFLGSEANPYLSENDKTPNYDGIIELLEDQIICGKITVQVKSYSHKYDGLKKFDIPTSLLGYAQKVPTEIVLLLVVDHANGVVYWKHISNEFISQNKSKAGQLTITYTFSEQEILCKKNLCEIINQWKTIYKTTAESIYNREKQINRTIEAYACAFEYVNTHFYSIPESYIARQELEVIHQWIGLEIKETDEEFDNICILTGDAGVGKSVVIKQLANKLKHNNIPLLAIKADINNTTTNEIIETINEVVNYLSSDKRAKAVLLIDQIDALSQSLSNDRAQINAYFSIINKFSNPIYSNLRIIISCRKFDLNYDPILSRLRTKKIVELGKLNVKEVDSILKLLMGESVANINKNTKQLLRTAQYLDTYCRIYRDNNVALNFSSHYKLYEELWRVKILHPHSARVKPDVLEQTMSAIAQKIYDDQTLSIKWVPSGKSVNYINYLSTEGIITYDNNTLRFFHQSFYDYVFARRFLSDKKSLYSFVVHNHQGLFIRSSIKQSLEFLKDYNADKYLKEIDLLLNDDQVRYHIKLLILQHLSSQVPNNKEINLILRLKKRNRGLFDDFIKLDNTVEWFDALIDKLEREIVTLVNTDKNTVLVNFLTSFSGHRTDKVFVLIDQIENEEIRSQVASRAIWFVRNYTNPFILRWYNQLYKDRSDFEKLIFLKRAINDNPKFVLSEVSIIMQDIVGSWSKNGKMSVDEWRFFNEIIESLADKYPYELYPILKNAVVELIKSTSHCLFNTYLKGDTAFGSYPTKDKSHLKLIDFLKNILKNKLDNDIEFVNNEIAYYLSTDSSTLYEIALEIMLEDPRFFTHDFYRLLDNHELVSYLLDNNREGYYFRELIKMSFPHLSLKQKKRIEHYALSFSCEEEKMPNIERRYMRPIYFNMGIRQRAFIYSLPEDALTLSLKHKKGELDRRFPWKYKNEKPSDHVPIAHLCGGLVSDEIYPKISLYNWESSFIKITRSRTFDLHFDSHTHARKFRECVRENPEKFYPFIFQIFDNDRIKPHYTLSGIQGLLDAQYKIDNLYSLLKRIYDNASDRETLYDIVETAQLFIKNGSCFSDDISEILIEIIKTKYVSSYNPETENEPFESDNRISNLLTSGINLLQGRAIKAFIENAVFKDRREKTYRTLIVLNDSLGVELKLTILYYLYNQDVYDEQLFDVLLPLCLQDRVSEFIYVAGNIINGYLSCKPDIVVPYLKSVENVTRAQNGLGVLYFLGCSYDVQVCKDVLYATVKNQNAEFCKGVLKAAFMNFSHPLCREHSLAIINILVESKDKIVIKSFAYKFSRLTSDDFPVIKYALNKFILNECVSRDKGIVDYLGSCAANYPEECFEYLDIMMRKAKNIEGDVYNKECLDILFAIYKYLKENPVIKEKIMDTLDFTLKKSYGNYGINEMLENVNRMD